MMDFYRQHRIAFTMGLSALAIFLTLAGGRALGLL